MPGYVIHLAVAERYLEKHPNKSENYEDFIEGVIFPDGVKDKSKTHYGNGSSNSNLPDFLNEHNLENSFDRGYFIHLLTDYLFYNKYIDTFSKEIYNDYDILNKELITKYHITLPDKAKKHVSFNASGSLKILSLDLVNTLIEEISELDIDIVSKEIKNSPDKWTIFRKLKEPDDFTL